jgi:hypothetical protein
VRLRHTVFSCGNCGGDDLKARHAMKIDFTAGYRYYRLLDNVNVRSTQSIVAVAEILDVEDHFGASNQFNGGELGVVTSLYRGRWGIKCNASAALGGSHEVVRIGGTTTLTAIDGSQTTSDSGFLAQQGINSGTFVHNEFMVIPKLSTEVSYQFTRNFRAYASYDVLYWSDVLRAGNQIDLSIFPGTTVTSFALHQTDFWAQGIRVGGELRY